jgi:hypothetical protein
MSIPHRHHFIPAFYLRAWAGTNAKLVEYTRKNGNLIAKPVGADATGYEVDLYAFLELPEDLAQMIEQKFFDYADRKAAEAHRLHLARDYRIEQWDAELVSGWSRFVVDLMLRHPDAMPELRDAAKAIWEGSADTAQRQYETFRLPEDPETVDEYLAQREPLFSVKARQHLVASVFDNEILGSRVNNLHWATLDVSAAPYPLLTSDRPVSYTNLKEPDGMLWLPVSPSLVFVAAANEKHIHKLREQKPKEVARIVNMDVVGRARRFVWSADRAQETFVEKHLSARLEPKPFFPGLARTTNPVAQTGG